MIKLSTFATFQGIFLAYIFFNLESLELFAITASLDKLWAKE